MKVTVRLSDIEAVIPELIPTFRQFGETLPHSIDIEGRMTVEFEKEKKMREQFPQYWDSLTHLEWLLFVQLYHERACDRDGLRTFMYAQIVDLEGRPSQRFSNVVDVHVKNLRRKLFQLGDEFDINTKRGWGYELVEGQHMNASKYLPQSQTRTKKKELNDDGSLKRKPFHVSRKLNAVEFGYLKELKMDEIPLVDVAASMKMSIDDVGIAWAAKNYDAYLRAAEGGIRNCTTCGIPGHNSRSCPETVTAGI